MVTSNTVMRLFAGLVVTLIIALIAGTPARAAYGTEGWAINDLILRQGPGYDYTVIGQITGKTEIQVERCAPRWCFVRQGHSSGWATRDRIGYGQQPEYPIFGGRPSYGSGTACFFTGTNYTGTSVCFDPGFVSRDLLLLGLDNSFASVQLPEGRGEASVCRNRDFQSYCERITESTPVLDEFLINNVSSIEIH